MKYIGRPTKNVHVIYRETREEKGVSEASPRTEEASVLTITEHRTDVQALKLVELLVTRSGRGGREQSKLV
jgi:hypothetical protein